MNRLNDKRVDECGGGGEMLRPPAHLHNEYLVALL